MHTEMCTSSNVQRRGIMSARTLLWLLAFPHPAPLLPLCTLNSVVEETTLLSKSNGFHILLLRGNEERGWGAGDTFSCCKNFVCDRIYKMLSSINWFRAKEDRSDCKDLCYNTRNAYTQAGKLSWYFNGKHIICLACCPKFLKRQFCNYCCLMMVMIYSLW